MPTELSEQIVKPLVLVRGDCHGHRRADNRGILPEDHRKEAGDVTQKFDFDTKMASMALGIFKENHALRLEAKKLRYMQQFSSPTNSLLVGSNAVPLPFNPTLLERLTISFHGGSLSSCDRPTSKLLTESVAKLTNYFPGLQALKIEINWDIDDAQERFGLHYIHLHARGLAKIKTLPLIDIVGAHKTCRDYIRLTWQLYEFCVRKACGIEVFSMDRSAVSNGKWEHDLEAAIYLFPNSNAWNPRGFQAWMSEYTVVHYDIGDVMQEGEPIAVEVITRAADLDPVLADGYSALSYAKSLTWATCYPAIATSQKAVVARENEEREARD
jgi:hypothetical protein